MPLCSCVRGVAEKWQGSGWVEKSCTQTQQTNTESLVAFACLELPVKWACLTHLSYTHTHLCAHFWLGSSHTYAKSTFTSCSIPFHVSKGEKNFYIWFAVQLWGTLTGKYYILGCQQPCERKVKTQNATWHWHNITLLAWLMKTCQCEERSAYKCKLHVLIQFILFPNCTQLQP